MVSLNGQTAGVTLPSHRSQFCTGVRLFVISNRSNVESPSHFPHSIRHKGKRSKQETTKEANMSKELPIVALALWAFVPRKCPVSYWSIAAVVIKELAKLPPPSVPPKPVKNLIDRGRRYIQRGLKRPPKRRQSYPKLLGKKKN